MRVFAPSYRRAAIMQASLAVVGCVAGLLASWRERDPVLLLPSLLLLAVVPFTLLVVAPTNNQLLDPALDVRSKRSADLLTRWGRLHAVRSLLSLSAFLLFLWRIAER